MKRHASMNRIYRLVWSTVRNVWIPVAEKARGRGKRSSRALVAGVLSLSAALAQAGPSGGKVVAGSGSIAKSNDTTTITQSSADLSLTWTSFNIAPLETVDFVQPSTSAIAVNRILGTNGTQILGHLIANGQVFLINPNGIVFGPTAEVNVGGFVASTLDLNEASLADATKSFSGAGTGSVLNQGAIIANQGGYVALLGNHVANQGLISAQLGTVALGAGSAATLTFSNNNRVRLQVDQSVLNSLAENGGLIRADGGQVVMTAGARDALLASVVNNTGVIEARTVQSHDGTITLEGGASAGIVKVGGTLDASAPDGGNGGFIETSAAHVEVADGAKVTTVAPKGLYGSWLIDPQDFTVAASGGDITGAELATDLATTPMVIQSSMGATAGSGNVNVNDAVAWSANTVLTLTASNNVNINANVTASGNTAGLVINPNTANGGETPSGAGVFNLSGAAVTLSGTHPSLSIAGATYVVINSLGAAGSTTGTDLQGINGGLTGHYALGTDIDASLTSTWNSGAGFLPIGSSTSFSGVFDGLGHTVSNLFIARVSGPTSVDVGLFGSITSSASLVQNVGVVGEQVSGGYNVGGLAGILGDGTVRNSYATGSVSGNVAVGGLVGYSYGAVLRSFATNSVSGTVNVGGLVGSNYGTISNSSATGSISGVSNIGGLVGNNNTNGVVTNSYATGNVTGTGGNVGGLVGNGGESTVTNVYATGTVHGATNVGGLVGYNYGGATIDNGYSTGAVSGTTSVGGLVGNNNGGTVGTSYWNTSVNGALPGIGAGTAAGATGLTTLQMQTASNFVGFTFTTTPGAAGNNWVMVDTDGTLNNAGGAGGATFPMLASEYSTGITNAHQLQLIAMALDATYTLGNDIDATNTDTSVTLSDIWSTPGGFVPIGSNASARFSGSFDGVGHTISNLTVNLPTNANVGLFGITAPSSVIQNVGLNGGSVTGANNTGDLVGASDGTINSSFATGNVVGSGGQTGGLVGLTGSGAVNNSYATGTVTGTVNVGGLVGSSYGTITNSHATGTVTGSSDFVGGLVGNNYGGTITNSFASGNVSGNDEVGGLVGVGGGDITSSYATGNVNGNGNDAGGLVGLYQYGAITNSHATGTVTSISAVGGLVGLGAGTIDGSYASGAVNGANYAGGLVGANSGAITNSHAASDVSGGGDIGGLVGINYGAAISTSFATGTVAGTSPDTGGLVGRSSGGLISNDYATGTVNGVSSVGGLVGTLDGGGAISSSHATGAVTSAGRFSGGLVGTNANGTIDTSYATGAVSGGDYTGGLVGANYGPITNSHATNDVSGGTLVGGLVGYNDNASITTSFATGAVVGTGDEVGGLVGGNYGSNPIIGSYTTGSVQGGGVDVGGLIGKNYGSAIVDNASSSGTVSGTNNVGGLVGFSKGPVDNSESTSTVTGNIIVGGLVGYNYGGSVVGSHATGSVTGSFIVGGLVGNNYGAGTISASHATGNVTGDTFTGGLVGQNSGSINTSFASGDVSGPDKHIGGLVGSNSNSVTNSYATGSVSGSTYVGGLVGSNYGAISNSYATGAVAATTTLGNEVGGLVGFNNNPGTISNSYATGRVTGISGYGMVGGLVGANGGAITNSYATGAVGGSTYAGGLIGKNYGTVSNTYATGAIGSSGAFVGGLIGDNTGTVSTSFWNNQVIATGIGSGTTTGATGLTSAGMMTMSNFTDAGWSISDTGGSNSVWRIYEGSTAPLLLSFLTPLTVTASNVTHIYSGVPVSTLSNPSYSISSAVSSGHLLGLGNPYQNAINVGTHAPALYSDQQGYDISYVNAVLTVTPATLTVTATDASKTYGQANPVLTGSVTGFVGADTLANSTTGTESFATNATVASNVGTYAISASGLSADHGNYVFSLAASNATAFTVNPATLTYTATAASFIAGQTPSGLTGTVSGFVLGETQSDATTGTLMWSTPAGAASRPGVYAIDGGGLTATNYVFVEAASNATALTLEAPTSGPGSGPSANDLLRARNVVTAVEGNLPTSQTTIQLALLTPSSAIAIAEDPGSAAIDGAEATAGESILTDRRISIGAKVPSLRVVRGGVKFPDNLGNVNAR